MPYADPEKRREYSRAATKRYRTRHRDEVLRKSREANRLARAKDPERFREASKKWYASHPDYWKNKYRSDPDDRLTRVAQSRIRDALKNGWKSARTCELLGCSIPELRQHLENQFRPGMTWENYGPVWHIDHIKPCAKFNLTDPAQQRKCFHFSNLQPLFAIENIRKGCR
jgi:Prasinovirus endonuclease VII